MFNLIKNKTFSVFDIGNNKIACLVFNLVNGKPKIIGMDHKKSKGIKKNKITNSEELSKQIDNVFKSATKNIKVSRKKLVFSNISDYKVSSKKTYTEIHTGKLGVTKKLIRKIYKKSVADLNIRGKKLIHAFPVNFCINGNKVTDEPIGLNCQKFGLSNFNLMVDRFFHENFEDCFKKKKLNVTNFFDSGVASAIFSLTQDEKKTGAVCVDIGAGSSKIVVFLKSKIVYVNSIPIGGNDVTSDISTGLDITEESAEIAKVIYGTLQPSFNEEVEINLDSNRKKIINKNLLFGIIKPRYEEILEIIRDDLFDNLHARIGINSVILTGGASKILGLENFSENIFNRKSRVGKVENISSFFYNKPEFSTLLGLIELAKKNRSIGLNNQRNNRTFSTIYEKFDSWIEDSYA